MSDFAPKKLPQVERRVVIMHHLSRHEPFRTSLIGSHEVPGKLSSRAGEYGITEFLPAGRHEWLARTDSGKVYRVTLDEASSYMLPVYIFRPLTEKRDIEQLMRDVARDTRMRTQR